MLDNVFDINGEVYFLGDLNTDLLSSSCSLKKKASNWNHFLNIFFIPPLFNQVGQLRKSSHLQLRPAQDKAKQCDKNNTELHMG